MFRDVNNVVEEARWLLRGYLKDVVDAIVSSHRVSNKEEEGATLALLALGNRLEEAYCVVFGLYNFIKGVNSVDYKLFVEDFVDCEGERVYKEYSLRELVFIFRCFLKGRSPLYKYLEKGLISTALYDLYLFFVDEGKMLSPVEVLDGLNLRKYREVYKRLEVYL